jgi:DNA-binding phage protein
MTLTRDFRATIKARADRDVEFRIALLKEAIELFLSGDVETGKALLRNYINASLGFKRLSTVTGKPPKSLMRMLSPEGNPTASNVFAVIASLQKEEGVHFGVKAKGDCPPDKRALETA